MRQAVVILLVLAAFGLGYYTGQTAERQLGREAVNAIQAEFDGYRVAMMGLIATRCRPQPQSNLEVIR